MYNSASMQTMLIRWGKGQKKGGILAIVRCENGTVMSGGELTVSGYDDSRRSSAGPSTGHDRRER